MHVNNIPASVSYSLTNLVMTPLQALGILSSQKSSMYIYLYVYTIIYMSINVYIYICMYDFHWLNAKQAFTNPHLKREEFMRYRKGPSKEASSHVSPMGIMVNCWISSKASHPTTCGLNRKSRRQGVDRVCSSYKASILRPKCSV